MVESFEGRFTEFEQLLRTARSVRKNLDLSRAIDPEDLRAAIDVAVQAPTGLLGENWRFLVVTAPNQKAKIAAIYGEILTQLMSDRGMPMKATHRALIDHLPNMPALIFVCAIGEPPADQGGQIGFYGSILPAAWSLMLALRGRGIGTTWTSLLNARADEIKTILELPDGVTQTAMFPAAYLGKATLRPADREPADQVTFGDTWNSPFFEPLT